MGGGKNSSDFLLTQFDLYRIREYPFKGKYKYPISTPVNWWVSVELKRGEDHIKRLALKIHSVVPQNATCERVFSILGWYLGKRRTRYIDLILSNK
jgi:hypothetical protein